MALLMVLDVWNIIEGASLGIYTRDTESQKYINDQSAVRVNVTLSAIFSNIIMKMDSKTNVAQTFF